MLSFVKKKYILIIEIVNFIALRGCLLYFIFVSNTALNFSDILNDCGLDTDPPEEVLKKISGLEEFYDAEDIVEIYNYVLANCDDYELLMGVIKLSDSYRAKSTLSILLKILLSDDVKVEDEDEAINLRSFSAKAISNYKDMSTVTALLHCLNNKNENYKIRLACADALGRIGDRFAVAPLIDVVKDEDEKSVYVKESAAFALGLIGDTSAIDPLVAIMDAKQGIQDKFSFLKEKIIEVLGMLNVNNNKVLNVLKNSLMDSSPMVRINSIEALMNSEFVEAPALIRKALKDEDEEVQKNALIALYNLIGRDILDEVISLPSYSKLLKEEAQNLIDEYEEEC